MLGPQKAPNMAARSHNLQAGKLTQLDTNSGGKDSNPALSPPVTQAMAVNPNHPMVWKTL